MNGFFFKKKSITHLLIVSVLKMSQVMVSICSSCLQLIERPDILTIALEKQHIDCASSILQSGQIITLPEVNLIVALDNVQLLIDVFNIVPNGFLPIQHVWKQAICNDCYNIMKYLSSVNLLWSEDIVFAATIGNFSSFKYLIENLNRIPTFDVVEIVILCDRLQMLKYLRLFAEHNLLFKKQLYCMGTIVTAFENVKLEILMDILKTDASLWNPSCMVVVDDRLGPLTSLNPQFHEDIITCARVVHDCGFLWPFYLCPVLFDGCALMNCNSCLIRNNSFTEYRAILNTRFKCQFQDIINLMVSFVVTYQQCDNCGEFENNKEFMRCSRCRTTYYCSESCQRKSWFDKPDGHKYTCGKFHHFD